MRSKKQSVMRFQRDVLTIVAVILTTILIVHSGVLTKFILQFSEQSAIASFVTGIFCTSFFTIAPAMVILVNIGQHSTPLLVAFWGGLGAMLGDTALFLFVRDVFADDLKNFLHAEKADKLLHFTRIGSFKWFAPIVGAIIIASPLPDEFGLALLGFSKIKLWAILPLTFVLNFVGIYVVVAAFAMTQ